MARQHGLAEQLQRGHQEGRYDLDSAEFGKLREVNLHIVQQLEKLELLT